MRVTIVLEKCARAQSWTLYMKRSELLDDIIGSQRFLDTALRHFSVSIVRTAVLELSGTRNRALTMV